jgi:mannose-1-phosphate guanylyltransferase
MASIMDSMSAWFYTGEEQDKVNALFPECKSISIDYAVMERLNSVDADPNSGLYVLPGDFGWSDLGTWGSLYSRLEKDGSGNAVVGDRVSMIESSGCIVRAPQGKRMVLQGMDDFIVAEDNGTLLICRKDQEQRIKEFSDKQ